MRYRDHNDEPFFVGEQSFGCHEDYIHYLAQQYESEEEMPEGWHEIAHTAKKEKVVNLSIDRIAERIADMCDDRYSEERMDDEYQAVMNAVQKSLNMETLMQESPELWYMTGQEMLITKSDVIEDLRNEWI